MFLTPFQTIIMILAVALGTQLTRWLPFLVFPEGKAIPPVVTYLGKVLPAAAMGLLVIYCLRNTPLTGPSHGIPEIASVAAVVLLHLWRKNTLLSILGGTLAYMFLVQTVFA